MLELEKFTFISFGVPDWQIVPNSSVDCANKRPGYATIWRPINYPRREKKKKKI